MIPTKSENNGGAAKQGRKRVITLGGHTGLRVTVAHPTANAQEAFGYLGSELSKEVCAKG